MKTRPRLRCRIASSAILFLLPLVLAAQQPPPTAEPDQQPPPPPAQLLPPQALDDLVAPVALYPDNILSQILVASTYPLEVVEAQQWLQRNTNLKGQALLDAAKQQNWDPSIQALVMFPDVLMRLNSDVRWTTDLGDAFLSQQADVMSAVQRMRARARDNGKLQSTPQENVTTQTQNGQTVIQIEPGKSRTSFMFRNTILIGPGGLRCGALIHRSGIRASTLDSCLGPASRSAASLVDGAAGAGAAGVGVRTGSAARLS